MPVVGPTGRRYINWFVFYGSTQPTRCSKRPQEQVTMRFTLLDRILEVEPGATITAVKNVSLSEEYLHDHFPLFPVLPGVFMLEAMTQAAAWLLRLSEDFAHSVVLLKDVHNVKYASFVAPGQTLTVLAEMTRQDERHAQFKVHGTVDGTQTVSGRLTLERFNLADIDSADAPIDHQIKQEQRRMLALLYPRGATDRQEDPMPTAGSV